LKLKLNLSLFVCLFGWLVGWLVDSKPELQYCTLQWEVLLCNEIAKDHLQTNPHQMGKVTKQVRFHYPIFQNKTKQNVNVKVGKLKQGNTCGKWYKETTSKKLRKRISWVVEKKRIIAQGTHSNSNLTQIISEEFVQKKYHSLFLPTVWENVLFFFLSSSISIVSFSIGNKQNQRYKYCKTGDFRKLMPWEMPSDNRNAVAKWSISPASPLTSNTNDNW
jgi:hypothetical protein